MDSYQISLGIDGQAEFNRVFKRFGATLSDLTEVWEEVKLEFWEIEKEQFDSEGAAGASGKWKPLSPKYAARKIEKYGDKLILQRTDALYKSMTGKTNDTVLEIKKDSIAIGSSLARAKYHHRGGGRLPKREVISFSDAQKKRLQKRIQKKMVKLIKQAGAAVD